MNIPEESNGGGDLTGNFVAGSNESDRSPTQELQALIDGNETGVYTTEQPSRACINEQKQSTNGKYFVFFPMNCFRTISWNFFHF